MARIYFISDLHLGAGTLDNPLDYERRVVRFLDSIKEDCEELYLLGDVIDFWFEYKRVAPQGFTRFLGKIGEFTDRGIKVHWLTGNHDIWIFDYIPRETGAIIHHTAFETTLQGKKIYLAHGDGLGEDTLGYKLMAGFFRNKTCQWLFSCIYPDWALALAHKWSSHSRLTGSKFPDYLGEDREHLVVFAKHYLKDNPDTDYLLFGHRHIMLDLMLSRKNRMMILGDWITHFSYAVLEDGNLSFEQFEYLDDYGEEERTGVSIAF